MKRILLLTIILSLCSITPAIADSLDNSNKEIIIDVTNIAESENATYNIKSIDKSWNVPGKYYIHVKPSNATSNPMITYRCSEVVPGVKYKLIITFVPDTGDEWRPSRISVGTMPMGVPYNSSDYHELFHSLDLPATEVTTIEADDVLSTSMGLDLRIKTSLIVRQNATHCREIRIADIRLVPVNKDTVVTPTFSWEGDKLAISTSTEGADIYYSTKKYDTAPSGDGSLSSPYNVAGVLQYISTLGAHNPSPDSVYIRGVVSSIRGIYPEYGNADFYITDDGQEDGNIFFAFRIHDLGGQLMTSTDAVKVGDEIIIHGKVTNYKGNTPETVAYEAYIYSFTTPEPNKLYQAPLTAEENTIVRAKATKEGMNDSEMAMLTIESEPYAILSNDNTVLTFYYDRMKNERNGMSVEPFTYIYGGVGSGWYVQRESITTVVFDDSFANCNNITSTAYWFYGCINLSTIKDIKNLKTENVTDMLCMFYGCSSLTTLDVSNFNTSNVMSMRSMFNGCSSLTTLDVSNFNTSNVISMRSMFNRCSSLTTLDMSNFNTSNVTDMYCMFYGCLSLTTLDVSNFNTTNVTDMYCMFYQCSSLTDLDVKNFKTDNVQNMRSMFSGCSSLTDLDISNFNTANVTSMRSMFNRCSSLKALDVSNFNTANVTEMNYMFFGCLSMTNLDVSHFNTENVTDMESMFGQCESLTSLDLSSFNTAKVTNMQNMFRQSPKLQAIYIVNEWSTTAVEQGDSIFYRCNNLVGGFGTTYDNDHIDYKCAHIDGGSSNPGYFTLIEFGDYQILKQFYNESNGDNWIRQWKISDTPSSVENFSGVVIERGRIVEINLPNNNIDGAFPYILLSLPNLRKLDVSRNSFLDDIGTSATLFALQNPSIISNIKELNISNNKFSGNIGLFAKIFTQLETLDASKNCLETVFPMISPKVTSLNLSSQTINRVIDLHLAHLSIAEVVTKLPTILIYDHKNQTFTPNINLFCSTADNSWNMALSYQNGQLTVPYVPEQNTYYGQSGDMFNVAVLKNDGTPEGSTFRITLSFDKGDSNFDGQVNVLDLQTDINYIMEKYQKRPYNFTAANLWKDDLINIQDIICLVNLLINAENVGDEQSASARRRAMQMSDATVYVQNGQLMLNTTLPVAAFDITLSGADGINVTKDMERMGMTITKKVTHDGIRLIGYSMNGAYIPMGDTAIGTLSSNAACVRHAMLSDSEANGISVSVDANTTGIETVRMSSSESTEIYDLQGRKVNTMSHKGLYIMNGRKIIK